MRGTHASCVGHMRSLALENVPRCSGSADAVPHLSASDGKGGWFGGAGPECWPNNATCGIGIGEDPFPAPRMVRRVPINASYIATR